MMKPADWETAEVEVGSKFPAKKNRLPLENFVCKIVQADVYKSKKGNTCLRIAWDVAEGEYTDFYLGKFGEAQANNPSAKWKNCATHYISLNNTGRLKGFAKCLEDSNPRYQWDFDEKKLTGLKFYAQMAGERKSYNGHDYTEVSIANIYPTTEADSVPAAFMRKPKDDEIPGFGSTDSSGFGSMADGGNDIPF